MFHCDCWFYLCHTSGLVGAVTRLANRGVWTEYLQQGRAISGFECRGHRRMDPTDQIRCTGRSRPLRMSGMCANAS